MKNTEQIRVDFNRAISGSYRRNEQVIDDITFAKVPGAQWAGSDSEQFKNKPKPENNKIARQINRILGQYERLEMNAKIISASEKATDMDAEILQSRWRNDFNCSGGIEALNNAADEAFHGGFGAFKLVAKYEDEEEQDDDYQNLCIEPIYSAASSVVFDAGSIRKDKRDSKQCWHLIRVDRQSIEDEYGVNIASYPNATPDNNNYFDWSCGDDNDVYIAHYYEVTKKKVKEYNFDGLVITKHGRKITDDKGNKLDSDMLDLLIGSQPYEMKSKNVQCVEYALLSGDQFLIKPRKTPFKTIPVIPQYGYHQIINGKEFYCGEVARQRDNQRFLNMGFGSLMEIMAQPQVETPEYLPEQVQRFASMHQSRTVEGYAYMMSDPVKDQSGNIAHMGPVAMHNPPQIGTGMSAAMQFLNENITEQGGTGQTTLPSNASAEAVKQVNAREDDSYQPMFQNAMQSIKAACEVYIPAAKQLYFTNERSIRLEGPDGSYSQIKTVQYNDDPEMDGELSPTKNACAGNYDVIVKTGESHKAKKEADRQANLEILQYTGTDTPKGQLTVNNLILTTTGEDTADARRIARFENLGIMLQMGIDPQPKTDEEKQHLEKIAQQMQAQEQNQEPDASMVMAQAEMLKGQADLLEQQNRQAEMQIAAAKLQSESIGRQEKLKSETQLNIAKINQDQQKIDNDAADKATKNALAIAEAEFNAGIQLDNQINQNKQLTQ